MHYAVTVRTLPDKYSVWSHRDGDGNIATANPKTHRQAAIV